MSSQCPNSLSPPYVASCCLGHIFKWWLTVRPLSHAACCHVCSYSDSDFLLLLFTEHRPVSMLGIFQCLTTLHLKEFVEIIINILTLLWIRAAPLQIQLCKPHKFLAGFTQASYLDTDLVGPALSGRHRNKKLSPLCWESFITLKWVSGAEGSSAVNHWHLG